MKHYKTDHSHDIYDIYNNYSINHNNWNISNDNQLNTLNTNSAALNHLPWQGITLKSAQDLRVEFDEPEDCMGLQGWFPD